MESNVLELVGSFFTALWDGLSSYNIPGTDWSFSGFFIAIMTAGIIGKILHALFQSFTSHFDSDFEGGRSGHRRSRTQKGE